MNDDPISSLKILLHAPTLDSLARARNNATNLLKEAPPPQVRIVVNAEAVAAALDAPDAGVDALTWLCPNTLRKLNRPVRAPLQVLPKGAVIMLASLQQEGWLYVRA